MSILIDQTKRVLVQGITGREGSTRTKLMVNYGTQVVAGVTPGRGGQEVEGIPVYDTIEEAWEQAGHLMPPEIRQAMNQQQKRKQQSQENETEVEPMLPPGVR